MKYLSLCSGIEAATVAWHPLGWSAAAYSEIDPFPCEVLKSHYPETPNWGDMSKFKEWSDANIDVLVGGTPCQSFSVAGLRKGLDDPRGNLALTYLAIAAKYQPRWLVWENVPGVLSSGGGRDFGSFLGGMVKLGYRFAYRVLDAQYFGVAQRRRRVFVVAYFGDWRPAAAVLFERESLSGNPKPSREAGKGIAQSVAIRTANTSSNGCGISVEGPAYTLDQTQGQVVAQDPAYCLQTTSNDYSRTDGFNMVVHGTQDPCTSESLAFALGRNSGAENVVAFAENSRSELRLEDGDGQVTGALSTGGGKPWQGTPTIAISLRGREGGATAELGGSVANTLRASQGGGDKPYILNKTAVRRLTPVECERLQGFPDGYTRIAWRNKSPESCPDGPRYKALGNSMAVPVMRWIGERIKLTEQILREQS